MVRCALCEAELPRRLWTQFRANRLPYCRTDGYFACVSCLLQDSNCPHCSEPLTSVRVGTTALRFGVVMLYLGLTLGIAYFDLWFAIVGMIIFSLPFVIEVLLRLRLRILHFFFSETAVRGPLEHEFDLVGYFPRTRQERGQEPDPSDLWRRPRVVHLHRRGAVDMIDASGQHGANRIILITAIVCFTLLFAAIAYFRPLVGIPLVLFFVAVPFFLRPTTHVLEQMTFGEKDLKIRLQSGEEIVIPWADIGRWQGGVTGERGKKEPWFQITRSDGSTIIFMRLDEEDRKRIIDSMSGSYPPHQKVLARLAKVPKKHSHGYGSSTTSWTLADGPQGSQSEGLDGSGEANASRRRKQVKADPSNEMTPCSECGAMNWSDVEECFACGASSQTWTGRAPPASGSILKREARQVRDDPEAMTMLSIATGLSELEMLAMMDGKDDWTIAEVFEDELVPGDEIEGDPVAPKKYDPPGSQEP